MTSVTETMRAAFYERQGKPAEVLQVGRIERPVPAAGEVLVRVHASGVNPSDTYGRAGSQNLMPFPRIVPHQDGAGVIEAVGDSVDPARVGQRVWVYEATWNRPWGTAAEYTAVPSQRAVALPDAASFEVGACLGVPAMTAHRAVFAAGPVAGKTVLVTGGAGSVGALAVQFARWGGAGRVIATVSSDVKAAVAREAGAHATVNYRAGDAAEEIKRVAGSGGVDHIAEVDVGGNMPVSLAVLAQGGSLAGYASRGNQTLSVPFRALMQRNVSIHAILVYSMPEAAKEAAMADITRALEQGCLSPHIARRFPLEQIAEAHEAVESWRLVGHAVLTI